MASAGFVINRIKVSLRLLQDLLASFRANHFAASRALDAIRAEPYAANHANRAGWLGGMVIANQRGKLQRLGGHGLAIGFWNDAGLGKGEALGQHISKDFVVTV